MRLAKEKQAIRRCFDRAVDSYDRCSQLQQTVGRCLIALSKKYGLDVQSVADIGCGTGLVTADLFAHFSGKTKLAIDLSGKLLDQAKRRLGAADVDYIQADYDSLPLSDSSLDIIFSSMSLQWSLDFPETLADMHRVLVDAGYLLLSIPVEGTFSQLNLARSLTSGRHDCNEFLSPETIGLLLSDLNFSILDSYIEEYQLPYSTIFELVNALRDTGANHIKGKRQLTYPGKDYFKKLEQNYYTLMTSDQLQLDYRIMYIIARKERVNGS